MNTEREDGEIYSDLADLDLGAEIAKVILFNNTHCVFNRKISTAAREGASPHQTRPQAAKRCSEAVRQSNRAVRGP